MKYQSAYIMITIFFFTKRHKYSNNLEKGRFSNAV